MIQVDLSELRVMARRCQEVSAALRDVAGRCQDALAYQEWQSSDRPAVEAQVSLAVRRATTLAHRLAELGAWAEGRAEAFRAADEEGARRIDKLAVTIVADGVPPMPTAREVPGPEHSGPDGVPIFPPAPEASAPAPADPAVPSPGVTPAPAPRPSPAASEGGDGVPVFPEAPAPVAAPVVPLFKQYDPAWGNLSLDDGTWTKYGCTLTSMAMTVQSLCPDVAVDRTFMANLRDATTNATGDVLWNDADAYLRQEYGLGLTYSDAHIPVSSVLHHAAQQLAQPRGVPTIVGLYPNNGKPMHWVVVTGFSGDPANPRPSDFSINDPGGDRTTLDAFLAEWGSPTNAARYVNIQPVE